MNRRGRVFFLGPINTSRMAAATVPGLLVGAASRKVLSMVSALRGVGRAAHLIAAPVLPAGGRLRRFAGGTHREGGASVIRLPALTHGPLNRLLAAWSYLAFCLRVRRDDAVVLYNFYPEFLPAALLLRLRGRPAVLDIEDFPNDRTDWRERVGRWSYRLVRPLCRPGILAASTQIVRLSRAPEGCVVHGVALADGGALPPMPPCDAGLQILFGGSMHPETGVDLLAEAVRILRRTETAERPPIVIHVTGFGDIGPLVGLADDAGASRIRIRIAQGLDLDGYRKVLAACHCGLSLKLPRTVMGDTTFPSKVIEIAANGLALVSTAVSDVPDIYAGAAAFVDDDPATLAARLAALAADRGLLEDLRRKGHARTLAHCSPAAVGARLDAFLARGRGPECA